MMTYSKDTKDVIFIGDTLKNLKTMASNSIDMICTSPPYYGLRSYVDNSSPLKKHEIGLEETPEQYIDNLVSVFREARRVLKDTGTLWLNLGDSYWHNRSQNGEMLGIGGNSFAGRENHARAGGQSHDTYKPKDLMLMPFRVAMALQADGWYLRQVNIWHKNNPIPESVKDRTTTSHEYVFHLSKSKRYFYNQDAIREPHTTDWNPETNGGSIGSTEGSEWYTGAHNKVRSIGAKPAQKNELGRNARSVWTINTKPYAEAHFAVMPLELADKCVKAGCPEGGIVLDPFGGAGTTAIAALQNLCHYFLIELNPEYVGLAQKRIKQQRLEGVQLELFSGKTA